MKLNQSFFGIAPKAFKAIDVNLAGNKPSSMVNSQVPVSTEHKGIIASKFISIDNGAASYSLYGHLKDRLSAYVFNHLNLNNTISLEDSEDWNFVKSAPAAFSLTSAAKICFIKFYLATQKFISIFGIGNSRDPDKVNRLKYRRITKINLLGYLSGRYFKFKELYNPKPFFIRYFKLIKPSRSKIMELISTALTVVSFIRNSIDFIALTPGAKNMAFFPAVFSKEQTGFIFSFTDEFKCI